MVFTKFLPVSLNSQEVRTEMPRAHSSTASSPASLVRAYTPSGLGRSLSTYGLPLRPSKM